MEESDEHQEEWIEIIVGVELQPWPDSTWLTFWREEDLQWPKHLEEPLLDGRKLIFTAPENNLEEAWSAVKARVEGANRLYREEYPPEEKHAPDAEEQEALARLREAAQRRIDALE
jgi:hypothetical protein